MTVINRQYNYIFIHVPKAAGKSVKRHLLESTFSAGERRRLSLAYSTQALASYLHAQRLGWLLPRPLGFGGDECIGRYCREQRLFTSAHLRAAQVRQALGEAVYRDMFSFAFVRNPWDRCLSAYFYFRRKRLHPLHRLAMRLSFEDFLAQLARDGMPYVGQQALWLYAADGRQLVDYIGRVENIGRDMGVVADRIGSDAAFAAHVNRSPSRDRDYRPYYSDSARELVAQVMARDIELLDYRF
ncbi:MAG: hypothetical protein CME59_02760 [Halioglobus sp.]|nr:hypothetical protein [Halioglobus sp.]